MQERPGHVAGRGGGVPSCGRNEGASMWMDWGECVQDEDKSGGEMMAEGSMGSRTRTGLAVLQRRRGRARRDPIGQGERGEDGRSGTS